MTNKSAAEFENTELPYAKRQIQMMDIHVLSEMLSLVDNPAGLGDFLCNEIRKISGAQGVFVLQCLCTPSTEMHRILSVNPPELQAWAQSLLHDDHVKKIHEIQQLSTWHFAENATDDISAQSQNSGPCMVIPLEAGPMRVGAIFLSGLPVENLPSEQIKLLHNMSTIAALVLRGAFLMQKQEQLIAERTKELEKTNDELQISLTKYRVLFDTFPLGITITDKDGNIVEVNQKGEELLGLPANVHKERKIDSSSWSIVRKDGSIMPPDEFAGMIALKENRVVENIEMGIFKPSNDLNWINVTAAPIPIEDLGVAITYSDINERRLSEETLRSLVRLSELSISRSLDELLVATLDEICTLTESPFGLYQFLEADQRTITLQAWSSRAAEELSSAHKKGARYDIAQAGQWADCIAERKALIFNDYGRLAHSKGLPFGQTNVNRLLSVPIIRREQIVAIITVANKSQPYNTVHIEALSMLADMAWEIVERSRAEWALIENEELFRKTFEEAPLGMAHVAPDGRFLRVNQRCCDILGYTRAELLSRTYHDITHPDDLADTNMIVEQILMGELEFSSTQKRYYKKNGEIVWGNLVGSLLNDASGAPKYFITALEDITTRKQAEEELRRLQHYLVNIIDSMPAMLIGLDKQGKISLWNRKAAEFSNTPADKALGRELDPLLSDFVPWIEALRGSISNQQPAGMEKILINKDGERRFFDIMIYPLTAVGVEDLVLRIDDVTQRTRIQELMIQSEKMTSLGGLAAGIAHEINNPLGIITQAAQIIERRFSTELTGNHVAAQELGISMQDLQAYFLHRRIPEFIASIRQATSRTAKIINHMLSFSRNQNHHIQNAHLPDVIEQALELASNDYDLKKRFDFRSIAIRREYENDLPAVPMAIVEIEQVLLNLLKNAAQAVINNSPDKKPMITIRLRLDERYISLEVQDNGPGMDEHISRRVFEPFFTTKEPGYGTGLGLPVSYMIITQNHKGLIEVNSSPGEGARFIIRLPLRNEDVHV